MVLNQGALLVTADAGVGGFSGNGASGGAGGAVQRQRLFKSILEHTTK